MKARKVGYREEEKEGWREVKRDGGEELAQHPASAATPSSESSLQFGYRAEIEARRI